MLAKSLHILYKVFFIGVILIKDEVALILNGGGGKGAYQIGVLDALKENGLLENVTGISGSSIGAVNAFLFAMEDKVLMYKAWKDLDMFTLFDFDFEMLFNRNLYFSRDQMIKLIKKYIDFNKLTSKKYSIYTTICQLDNKNTEYRKISDIYDYDLIIDILLASTALPIIYEAVTIDGKRYRDGGICDNEPIKPLYDEGYRKFIVISMKKDKRIDKKAWPDATFIDIFPSYNLGELFDGTLNFSENAIRFRELLGYMDGYRAIKTKFFKEEIYIRLEPLLAESDYNEIKYIIKNREIKKNNDISTMLLEKYLFLDSI